MLAMIFLGGACSVTSQQRQLPTGPVASDQYKTVYIRIDNADDGLLYEPVKPGENARVALVLSHPDGNVFNASPVVEMARRGYRVLAINHHGDTADVTVFAQPISRSITFLRNISGVQKVVIMGHSGGGHLMAWYGNVAEHGAAACNGPEKIYPCDGKQLNGLAKPDGIILLDSTLGAFHEMSAVDPAVDGEKRISSLDMFSPANGYDTSAKQAKYSADFAKRFYAAQAARNTKIVDDAVSQLKAIQQGQGKFSDDEPLLIRGMGEDAAGARLYQPDPSFVAHTKASHILLKADGTEPDVIVPSVRGPEGAQFAAQLNSLTVMSQATTVRKFLAHSAIRTSGDYAITSDDIVGVDWKSAVNSTPGNAEGITVPALIVSNTCHYLIVPDEIIYDHLGSADKTLAYNEGATHGFTACKPEYGDTVRRAFDYIDKWLQKPGRF
jgi:pimeloyl-ACP methyl ester carboxylesterase